MSQESLEGLDLGDEVAKWLTTYLGEPLRLVYSSDDINKRQLTPTKTHAMHRKRGYDEVADTRKKVKEMDNIYYL